MLMEDEEANVSGPSKRSLKKHRALGKSKEKIAAEESSTAGTSAKFWEEEEPWSWTTLVGSFEVRYEPAFTKDGRYVFIIAGPSVKMYSVLTGEVVSTFHPPHVESSSEPDGKRGRGDIITSISLHPTNPFQLLTGSLDGKIRVWDFLEGNLLQTINIGDPISHISVHEKFKEQAFVAVMTKLRERKTNKKNIEDTSGHTLLLLVSLQIKGDPSKRTHEVTRIGKTRVVSALAVSARGTWIGMIAGTKLYVKSTSALDKEFTKLEAQQSLTSLAFHPNDEYLVTGDEKGQLRFWYCLQSRLPLDASGTHAKAQTSTLHWHAHAVSSVTFTPNGAFLLSGGEEGVLVIWQLFTGKREFVPHLGAAIKSITIRHIDSTEEYLVGLLDGSFILVNGTTLTKGHVVRHVGICPIAQTKASKSTPLAIHPPSSSIIIPSSHPSSLQMYCTATWTVTSELTVNPANRISRRDEKPIKPPSIERIAITASGEWMATIDKRTSGGDEYVAEIFIRFWYWDKTTWILNTRFEQPHGIHSVVDLSFSPTKTRAGWLLSCTGLDRQVKLWRNRNRDAESESEGWMCYSVLSFRSGQPSGLSWSPDSSVLSVVFGPQVVLFSVENNKHVCTLTTPSLRKIEILCSVGRSGRYLLVCDLRNGILWDLVSHTIRWHYRSPCRIVHAVRHPSEDVVTLVLHSRKEDKQPQAHALMFQVTSPKPIRIRTVPFWLRNLMWYEGHKLKHTFIGITSTWDVVVLGDGDLTVGKPVVGPSSVSLVLKPQKSLLSDVFGESFKQDLSVTVPVLTHSTTGDAKWESAPIFNGVAYLAPSLQTIYQPFMEHFLRRRPEPTQTPGDAMDVVEDEPLC